MAAARRRKTRAQPSGLTKTRVAVAALDLIEREGLDAFSTRKLGRVLGVEAMAIYWYYPSKEALLDAVVELLVAKLGGPPTKAKQPPKKPPDFIEALRQLAHAYRALAHAYPNAFVLLATRRFATDGAHRFLDGLFALAEAHGLDPRKTARFYRLVASYCNGVALDELAGVRELATQEGADEARGKLPRLAKVFAWLAPAHYEDVFSFGLELLLEAIESEAAKRPRKRR